MMHAPIEYVNNRKREWNLRTGFIPDEMVFKLYINGKDFYEFEEVGPKDNIEEPVYRIGVRYDERSVARKIYYDMRVNRMDRTCKVEYDPRSSVL